MKVPKKYSKKAKKSIKKYDDGGNVEEDVMDPSLNPDLPQTPTSITQTANANVNNSSNNNKSIGGGLAAAGMLGSDIVNNSVKIGNGVKNITNRQGKQSVVVNPKEVGKNVVGRDIGADALKDAGVGASIGMAAGPVGALIGGGIGAGVGALTGWARGKKEKGALQSSAQQQLDQSNAQGSISGAYGYKKGGKIKKDVTIKNATQNKIPEKSMGGGVGAIGIPLGPGEEAKHSNKKAAEFPKMQYKSDGGKINGKGTAKSDSIDAEVQQGSFIVPAENAKKAEKLRAKFLGNPDKKAKLKDGGGVEVMLSNGEHMFTPEEVKVLKGNGVDVEALAPNSEDKDSMKAGGIVKKKFTIKKQKKADGGEINDEDDSENNDEEEIDNSDDENDLSEDNSDEEDEGYKKGGKVKKGYANGTDDDGVQEDIVPQEKRKNYNAEDVVPVQKDEGDAIDLNKSLEGINPPKIDTVDLSTDKKSEPKITSGKKIFDALGGAGGLMALGQTGLGLATLYGAKRPVGSVDPQLLAQQEQALKESKQGLSPEENALARQDIENTRRGEVKNIVGLSGGSAGTALANIGTAGSRSNRGLLDLGVKNAEMRRKEESRADQLTGAVAGEKRQLVQDQLNAFNQNQKASADLTQAGLSNFFGNLSNQQDIKAADKRDKLYGYNNGQPKYDHYTGKLLNT